MWMLNEDFVKKSSIEFLPPDTDHLGRFYVQPESNGEDIAGMR